MSVLYGTKINQLLANTAPTGLLFADCLKKKGYSVQLQKKYRDSGWLTAICKGVMCRTGARLNAYDAIASYNKQMGVRCRRNYCKNSRIIRLFLQWFHSVLFSIQELNGLPHFYSFILCKYTLLTTTKLFLFRVQSYDDYFKPLLNDLLYDSFRQRVFFLKRTPKKAKNSKIEHLVWVSSGCGSRWL